MGVSHFVFLIKVTFPRGWGFSFDLKKCVAKTLDHGQSTTSLTRRELTRIFGRKLKIGNKLKIGRKLKIVRSTISLTRREHTRTFGRK